MCEEMEVVIAYSTRKQTPEDFEKYFNKNIKLVKINNFTRNINLIKDIKAIREVKQIVKQEKPDIVHMHSSKAGAIGRLAISSKQADLFYTPHGYAFCQKDASKLKVKIYKTVEKFLGKRDCMTIACSKGEYEEALKYDITKNITYINNGIDVEEMQGYISKESKQPIDVRNLKICTVGRIEKQKNPHMFEKIAQKFPDIQFTWIGDGSLREVVKSPNIKILGWCDIETTIKELYKNDIFILPSLWEGLPITLLEAMYLKKICIVSDVTGNRDVITNGEDGFICRTEDEYCSIIEKIQNEEIDVELIERQAIKNIAENHNIQKVAQKYLKIYYKEEKIYYEGDGLLSKS